MSAIKPDQAPDRDQDERSDLERAVERRSDDAEKAASDTTSPLEPTGVDDGVSGTAGVVKNQDDMAQ